MLTALVRKRTNRRGVKLWRIKESDYYTRGTVRDDKTEGDKNAAITRQGLLEHCG
jgi:hypothetical protein